MSLQNVGSFDLQTGIESMQKPVKFNSNVNISFFSTKISHEFSI
jgi:hypothetical protein